MTVEEPTNVATAVEEIPVAATEVKKVAEEGSAGNKRAFDEIQARAALTIHDLADEDEEDDPDYQESDVEEEPVEEEQQPAVEGDAEEDDEEEDEEDEEEEPEEEDISVEELTGVIEDAGLGEAPKGEELSIKVLRGGKKIARPQEAETEAVVTVEETA